MKELVLSNCIVVIADDISRSDILKNTDLHKFIKGAKHSINWSDAAFWRKLRYYLPDPVEGELIHFKFHKLKVRFTFCMFHNLIPYYHYYLHF